MADWWEPKLVGHETVARLRESYPETAHLDNAELLIHYGYEGHKYENSALWDHTGDAQDDYERLADAYLRLLSKGERR